MSNMYLLVNFGGPRSLTEIEPFLKELLNDRDVVRTKLPSFLHRFLFNRIAKKRALKIATDYKEIGGFSPIYFDTEEIAKKLSLKLNAPVFTFHRYLPETHFTKIDQELTVLPLFPQFSYATTGSIARKLLPFPLRWIKSYPTHPAFIRAYQNQIRKCMKEEENTLLLFSAHGLPAKATQEGDPYQSECEASFHAVMEAFPKAKGILAYQSKFGKGEWLRPYTNEVCEKIGTFNRKIVIVVPISFTSDHIETLFEIEKLYLPLIRAQHCEAIRCPALNLEEEWIDALVQIARGNTFYDTQTLVRKRFFD
jgi:protoporphyrin/coproporphyrin ferrochelatase